MLVFVWCGEYSVGGDVEISFIFIVVYVIIIYDKIV